MANSIERVQTGVRLEKRSLKVLKALAEYLDLSVGELLEGMILHVFEGKSPFSLQTLAQITRLRSVYGLTLTAEDSHALTERVSDDEGMRPTARSVTTPRRQRARSARSTTAAPTLPVSRGRKGGE